jgi:hypothetical protein
MTWGNTFPAQSTQQPWPVVANPDPMARFDAMDKDQVLQAWADAQKALKEAKDFEMLLRKYIVKRAFPEPAEGTNTQELGNGYELKAVVKFNYKLDPDNKKIEAALDRIAAIGNQGQFVADRLVSWTPNFLKTEYTNLQEEAKGGSVHAAEILRIIGEVLTIDDAAPTLDIKAPKAKK